MQKDIAELTQAQLAAISRAKALGLPTDKDILPGFLQNLDLLDHHFDIVSAMLPPKEPRAK